MPQDGAMRRWNGWGDESDDTRLSTDARRFLERRIGAGTPSRDARLEDVVRAVPASRLAEQSGLSLDPELRVRRARGQSFPDLVATRSGRLEAVPDAVARPSDGDAVRALLDLAASRGTRLVPWGGGTSVVGGVTARAHPDPLVTVDLGGLAGVRDVDERSGLVTVGAGTTGPALADHLGRLGLVVGHEPQSWELATVGGWVAARGSGLRSLGAGRIEQLFAGGVLEAPAGTLTMPPFPASAAGPDLRQLVLGSEGRLGILTDVALRATPAPEVDRLDAWAIRDWASAQEAVRQLARSRPGLSVLRVSTPTETRTLLAFAGRTRGMGVVDAWLRLRRVTGDWSLLLVGAAGPARIAKAARGEAGAVLRRLGGVPVPGIASAWLRTRFRSPYLRNALWSAGYGADTLETATVWSRVPALLAGLETAIANALAPRDERVHVMTHLSHAYPSGSSLYLTFVFRLGPDPEETLDRWRTIKDAASEAIVAEGATISHHHGVGTDHVPYLAAEKGELGLAALAAAIRTFDPAGIMNPGVLLPAPAEAGASTAATRAGRTA
jgi:alkyldihydroxyacetonephosphate synthase